MDELLLTDSERDLVMELLDRERRDLPAEIRHTSTSAVKDELRRRLAVVDGLLARLSPQRASAAAGDSR